MDTEHILSPICKRTLIPECTQQQSKGQDNTASKEPSSGHNHTLKKKKKRKGGVSTFNNSRSINVCSGSSSFVSLFFFHLTLQFHLFFLMSETTEQFTILEEYCTSAACGEWHACWAITAFSRGALPQTLIQRGRRTEHPNHGRRDRARQRRISRDPQRQQCVHPLPEEGGAWAPTGELVSLCCHQVAGRPTALELYFG